MGHCFGNQEYYIFYRWGLFLVKLCPSLSSGLGLHPRMIRIFLVPLDAFSAGALALSPGSLVMLPTHLVKCCFDEVIYFGKCPWGAAERFNSLSFP